jgi:hypothetical protein
MVDQLQSLHDDKMPAAKKSEEQSSKVRAAAQF